MRIRLILILIAGSALTAGEPQVCRWSADQAAAISFTFDDGPAVHVRDLAPRLEANGMRGTFFIIVSRTPDAPQTGPKAMISWPELRDAARRGHEIGNHSWTHRDLRKVTDLDHEIVASAERIREQVGVAPLSFAWPFCKSTPEAKELCLRHHLAERGYHPLYEGTYDPAKALAETEAAISAGSWLVRLSHGIDGAAFSAHLADLVNRPVWVAPYGTVAAYAAARERARIEWTSDATGGSLTVRLDEPAPAVLRTLPLTIAVVAAGSGTPATDPAVPVRRVGDRVLVDLIPDGRPVRLRW